MLKSTHKLFFKQQTHYLYLKLCSIISLFERKTIMLKQTSRLFVDKYQPVLFQDFDLDKNLFQILNTMISMDTLNILFVGDVASGKTSILNALIREYFGSSLKPSDYHENILFINNLKEQGINYYRSDVKTFCQTSSIVKGRKKFVVLDDIDLINEQSQQVFRNCMDKYSKNVHFIASCSNIQKVIESIQSRFTILKLKPVSKSHLLQLLHRVKKQENIHTTNEDAVIDFVVNASNNSVKVALNYLEKFKLLLFDNPSRMLDLETASQLCSNMSQQHLIDYTMAVTEGRLQDALNVIYNIYDMGYSVMDILDSYFSFVKVTPILNDDQKYKIIPFICKYITIFNNMHEDEVELAFLTNDFIKVFSPKKE